MRKPARQRAVRPATAQEVFMSKAEAIRVKSSVQMLIRHALAVILTSKVEFMLQHHHPVPEGRMFCTACHDMHGKDVGATGGTMLLGKDERCFKCHKEMRGPFVFEHEAMREGCPVCHTPHGSINDKLLVAGPTITCVRCHIEDKHGAVYGCRCGTSTALTATQGCMVLTMPHHHCVIKPLIYSEFKKKETENSGASNMKQRTEWKIAAIIIIGLVIFEGFAWAAEVNEPDKSYKGEVQFRYDWIGVNKDRGRFREDNWMTDGSTGGLDWLHIESTRPDKNGYEWLLEGRATARL